MDFFRHYVVNESGEICAEIIKLLSTVLLPNLQEVEPDSNITIQIIETFIVAKDSYSAKPILQGLEQLPFEIEKLLDFCLKTVNSIDADILSVNKPLDSLLKQFISRTIESNLRPLSDTYTLLTSILLLVNSRINTQYSDLINPKKEDDAEISISKEDQDSLSNIIDKVFNLSIWILHCKIKPSEKEVLINIIMELFSTILNLAQPNDLQ
jgi:hypothetical protein